MNAERSLPLHRQLLGVTEEILDIGAELLALREVLEERSVVVDQDDLVARILRFKSELDHGATIAGRLVALERSRVDELLGESDPPDVRAEWPFLGP